MQKFIVKLTNQDITLIDDANLECFVVDIKQPEADKLIARIKAKDKIALIEGNNEEIYSFCRKYNADGILIDLSKSEHCAKDVNYARKQIGDKILGVISRNRRHEAMLISECEPDFVAFKVWNEGIEQVKELLSWYTEMFLIQSAAVLAEPIDNVEQLDCDIVVCSEQKYRNL